LFSSGDDIRTSSFLLTHSTLGRLTFTHRKNGAIPESSAHPRKA
jgi:hypothetical protein